MPDPRVTIIIEGKDNASDIIKEVENSLSGLGQSADKVEQAQARTTRTTQVFGQSFRELRHITTGAFLGLDAAIAAVGQNLDKDQKNAVTMARSIAEVGLSAAFFGPLAGIVAGVGFAIGLVASQAAEAKAEIDKIDEPFKKIREEIDALIHLKGLDSVAKDLNVSVDGLRQYIASGEDAANTVQTLNAIHQKRAEITAELTKLQDGLNNVDQRATEATAAMMYSGMGSAEIADQLKAKIADLTDQLTKLDNAEKAITPTIQENTQRTEEANRLTEALKKGIVSAADEIGNYKDKLSQLAATHATAMNKIKEDWSAAFDDAEEKADDAWTKAAKDVGKIEQELNKNILKENESLGKELDKIKADEAKADVTLAKDQVKLTEDTSKQLEKIETDRINALATLDRDTGIKLRDATTEHEREALLEERANKIAEIAQSANDKRAALAQDQAQRQADLADRRAQTAQEFADRRTQAAADAAERMAQMRQDAEDRKAERREQRDDEIKAINDALGKQLDAINKRKAEEEASYTAQVAAENNAHAKRMKNLLDTRDETQKLADDWNIVRGNIDKSTASIIQFSGALATANSPAAFTPGMLPPFMIQRGNFQQGGDFVVPPGFGNDSYRIGVSSGERVTVTPPGQTNNSRSFGNFTFNVMAHDPVAVREEIRRYMEDLAWVG